MSDSRRLSTVTFIKGSSGMSRLTRGLAAGEKIWRLVVLWREFGIEEMFIDPLVDPLDLILSNILVPTYSPTFVLFGIYGSIKGLS